MKTRFVVLAISCILATVATAGETVPPKTHPDSASWNNLVAADLSDAEFPQGVWSSQDGVLTATEDQCLWTKKSYDNFVLDLEFKTADGTNSGVIVHCSNMKDWIPNSVEIQIADDFSEKWGKSPKTWQCAAIFGRLGGGQVRRQEAGRVEPDDDHLPRADDLRAAERPSRHGNGHAKVDGSEAESGRQRDPALAEQAAGRDPARGPHRPARQARRGSDLLSESEDQDAGVT